MKSFEEKLQIYASLAVRVGANVQPGQIVYVRADVENAQLMHLIVEEAYRAGARDVVWKYLDGVLKRTKFELAPEEAFKNYYAWDKEQMDGLSDEGAVFLSIVSDDPDQLLGIDPKRVATWIKTESENLAYWRKCMMSDRNSWSILGAAGEAWAKKVFPNDENAVDKLWDAIFAVSRIDEPDPVQAWRDHNKKLHERVAILNEKRYRKLHYRSAGTDLTIGLHPTHLWAGGGATNKNGVPFMPNIPTEEVFTCPVRTEVDGYVSSTKPLVYNGNVIDRFKLMFKDGRIVGLEAEQGEEILRTLIETDDGSYYLGEVALVPFDSPISNSNILFYNTLFDENASNHLAIGAGYASNVEGGKEMSKEELVAVSVNHSLIHEDFMIGSADMDIDGIKADGTVEPIFRNGNWAF